MIAKPTPEQVKAARQAASLTQAQAAEIFGYSSIGGWQQKEIIGKNGRALSAGEYAYLLLLAGQHPEYELVRK